MTVSIEKEALALSRRIGGLEQDSVKMATVGNTTSKLVWSYLSQPVIFQANEFTQRESTWFNGVEDFHITELTYACYKEGPPLEERQTALFFFPQNHANAVSVLMGGFEIDFQWNYRVEGRASMFLPNSSGGGLLPRTLLGYPERGQYLKFARPLYLRAGGALTFICKPTIRTPVLTEDQGPLVRTVVNFVAIGYRTGAQAWTTAR